MNESFYLIMSKYDLGVYTLKDIFNFVQEGVLTKKQFFEITRQDYEGVKKVKGW